MKYILIIFSLWCPLVSAGLEQDMYRALGRLGVGANVTATDVVKGQEGPFVNGGGVIANGRDEYIQFYNLSPPRVGFAACGIDWHFGGITFISSDKMLKAGRAIVGDALVYAASLALQQLAPQIANRVESFQAQLNEWSQFSIGSCEAGRKIVDTISHQLGASQKSAAQEHMVKTRKKMSHQKAGETLNQQGKTAEVMKEMDKDPEKSRELFINKNLAWDTIQNEASLKGLATYTKYLLMSLSGTIVIKANPKGGDPNIDSHPSLLITNQDQFIASLLGISKTKKENTIRLYTCNDNKKCLSVTKPVEVDFQVQDSFSGHIKKMIASIEKKIFTDEALSKEEAEFVAKTDIPIKRMIRTDLAFNRGITLTNGAKMTFVHQYRDAIAMDLLYDFLQKHVAQIRAAIKADVLPKKLDRKYKEMLDGAESSLYKLRQQQLANAAKLDHSKGLVDLLEKKLMDHQSTEILSKMGQRANQGD